MKRSVYVIDLTAAFDHVSRGTMFAAMNKRLPDSQSKKLINLLEVLYLHTTAALAEAPYNVFETKSGVRQGGPESPMVFSLYENFVMRTFLKDCNDVGIKFMKLKYRIPESASNRNREST